MRYVQEGDSQIGPVVIRAIPETEYEVRQLCERPWIPGEGLMDRRGHHGVDCPHTKEVN